MFNDFFKRIQGNLNPAPSVTEDPDQPGYFRTPVFKGASRKTKVILCDILPESEWDQMRENALNGFLEEGSYYTEDYA